MVRDKSYNGSLDEYTNVIELSKANDNLRHGLFNSKITIGNNEVDVDLTNKDRAQFIHRPDVKSGFADNPEIYEALCYTAIEYIDYAVYFRKDLNKKVTNNEEFTPDECNFLEELHKARLWCENSDDANSTGTKHFAFICDLWDATGVTDDLGLCELYDLSLTMSSNRVLEEHSQITKDYTQPLTAFYTVNESKSVTGISWSSIKEGTTKLFKGLAGALLGDSEEDEEGETPENAADSAAYDSDTKADRSAVSLSTEILQGIAYSAAYVPMQTNLYSTATINTYDQDWLRDFHYKYGFLRKALYKDTSATANPLFTSGL